ncbi:hypothetical protein FSP39_004769 [Pinctada imbricata]|uniref:Hydroxysteroid 17-beta dehydrogenase 4 n=2 Tax=Pinctada TaxID=50425 RepID=A0AA88Y341_PINIB|nr:hypothetical protein FSP39_004769 [Pinctada imbricata]
MSAPLRFDGKVVLVTGAGNDLIHRVHLRGSFQVTRAAWPHMKKNNYGRIIMVSSAAGIYGNFGQANYSAAKLGIYGLANTLSIEGKKNNIHCNTIAPVAGSRMTETVMPPEVLSALKPEYVAPLVVYLCHESCEDTGGLFELGAGWIAKLRDNWDKVTDFTDSTQPSGTGESTMLMMNVVKTLESDVKPNQTSGGSGGVDVEAARRQKPLPSTYTYTERDVILYNLGGTYIIYMYVVLSTYTYTEREMLSYITWVVCTLYMSFSVPTHTEKDVILYNLGGTYIVYVILCTYTYTERDVILYNLGGTYMVYVILSTYTYTDRDVILYNLGGTYIVYVILCTYRYTERDVILYNLGGTYIVYIILSTYTYTERDVIVYNLGGTYIVYVILSTYTYTDRDVILYNLGGTYIVYVILSTYKYTDRDVILYNLGVGSSTEHEEHLKFLFEGSDDFCVIPSFGVIPAFSSMSIASNVPGLDVDPTKILHGEQYLEIYKPFPARGATLKSYARIADVLDKGSGAVIIANVETFDEQNEKVCFNQFSTFVVGAGKFGGKRTSTEAKPTMNPPQRQPDASITEQTGRDQAALYRLSGDRNPLHIDPSFAAMGGFAEPILHGLCSFGYATRHVLKQYCDNDVTKIKAIKVRFSRPVLPGQNIRTDMWKDGNRVYFQCKVVDNGYVSLSGAYIDLHGSTDSGPSAGPAVTSLMSDGLFEGMAKRAESQPALAKKINAVFAFEITKDGKTAAKWTADMKTGAGVYRGDPKGAKADCTLIIDDKNMVDMASGKLNGQQAFMKGLLKIKGNMMLAQKLGDLLKDNSKM